MNTIFSLVQLLAFHFFISLCRADPSNYPLIYNPNTSRTYTKFDLESIQSIEYPVFAACPAEGPEEEELIKKQLIDRKALFTRKSYAKDILLEGIRWCEKNFELAVIINSQADPAIIEFGYLIYSENAVVPKTDNELETDSYSEYTLITGENLLTVLSLAENRSLSFKWVQKIVLEFDVEYWDFKKVTYDLHRSADRINVQCNDNNLGMEYFNEKKEKFYEYYSNENLKNVLNDVQIPETSICQTTAIGCLERYNLLKPHHFQTINSSSNVSCSDSTLVAIWSDVNRKLLNYTELFLTAISEITENRLIIITGGYGAISLMKKNNESNKIIYLHENEVSVPHIIFKIVRYKSHDCDDKTEACWFNIVIAIHNEPEVKDKLCPTDVCEELGWESIQYMSRSATGKKSEHIYCCRLDENSERRLDYERGDYIRGDLNLTHFPVYNKNESKNEFENRQVEFLEKMDILLNESSEFSHVP